MSSDNTSDTISDEEYDDILTRAFNQLNDNPEYFRRIAAQMRGSLERALNALSPEERELIEDRFGLRDGQAVSSTVLAHRQGVTVEELESEITRIFNKL